MYWVALTRVAALDICRILSIVLGKLRCFPALVCVGMRGFLGACIILNDSMKRCCCCGSFLEEKGNVR